MFSHKSLVKNLVYLIVWRPLITDNVIRNGFNKLIVIVVTVFFFLQIWVRIARDTFRIIKFHVGLIGPYAIEGDQVYDGFLPGVWLRKIEICDRLHIIVFNLIKSTLVRHISLSHNKGHWINLQKQQVWLGLCDGFSEDFHETSISLGHKRYSKESGLRISRVICF